MTEITLIRHGAVDGAGCCYGQRHDVPLSGEGRRQARALAERLGTPPRLLSSPAARARATAKAFGIPIEVDPRWAERDFGQWESRPWDDCWAEAPEALAGIDAYVAFTPPGAEPLEEVAQRVEEALESLRAGVAVVTHGGPIRLAVRYALGLSWAQAFALDPAPGTVTRLRRTGRTWAVDCVGCG